MKVKYNKIFNNKNNNMKIFNKLLKILINNLNLQIYKFQNNNQK